MDEIGDGVREEQWDDARGAEIGEREGGGAYGVLGVEGGGVEIWGAAEGGRGEEGEEEEMEEEMGGDHDGGDGGGEGRGEGGGEGGGLGDG